MFEHKPMSSRSRKAQEDDAGGCSAIESNIACAFIYNLAM